MDFFNVVIVQILGIIILSFLYLQLESYKFKVTLIESFFFVIINVIFSPPSLSLLFSFSGFLRQTAGSFYAFLDKVIRSFYPHYSELSFLLFGYRFFFGYQLPVSFKAFTVIGYISYLFIIIALKVPSVPLLLYSAKIYRS